MDARRIPCAEEFDVIGAYDVLEHIVEDETVLGEMRRALKPGGGSVITVPQHPWLWSHQDEYACHVPRYRVGELRDKVVRAGFHVLFETDFVSLLLPAMLVSRMARRHALTQSDTLAELRPPTPINRLFETVMDFERVLLQRGIRYPVGVLACSWRRNNKASPHRARGAVNRSGIVATAAAFASETHVWAILITP